MLPDVPRPIEGDYGGIYKIQGELLYFFWKDNEILLRNADGEVRFRAPARTNFFQADTPTGDPIVSQKFFNPDDNCLSVCTFANFFERPHIGVIQWHIADGRVEQEQINIGDIFKVQGGKLRPANAESISN